MWRASGSKRSRQWLSERQSGKTRPGWNQRTPRSVIRATLGNGEVVAAIPLPWGDGELELGLLLNGHQQFVKRRCELKTRCAALPRAVTEQALCRQSNRLRARWR